MQVDVGDLQPDRLRGAQPAGVHHLEQRPVAQGRRLVAARGREQLLHLGVVEDLGQLLGPARGAERRGRVVADQLVAAQLLVEGAQAGRLAMDGRGRAGRTDLAGRQLGEELADVGGPRGKRVEVVGGRGTRRTGGGRCGRRRACCARGLARAPGRRGSRGPGTRSGFLRAGAMGWRLPWPGWFSLGRWNLDRKGPCVCGRGSCHGVRGALRADHGPSSAPLTPRHPRRIRLGPGPKPGLLRRRGVLVDGAAHRPGREV